MISWISSFEKPCSAISLKSLGFRSGRTCCDLESVVHKQAIAFLERELVRVGTYSVERGRVEAQLIQIAPGGGKAPHAAFGMGDEHYSEVLSIPRKLTVTAQVLVRFHPGFDDPRQAAISSPSRSDLLCPHETPVLLQHLPDFGRKLLLGREVKERYRPPSSDPRGRPDRTERRFFLSMLLPTARRARQFATRRGSPRPSKWQGSLPNSSSTRVRPSPAVPRGRSQPSPSRGNRPAGSPSARAPLKA